MNVRNAAMFASSVLLALCLETAQGQQFNNPAVFGGYPTQFPPNGQQIPMTPAPRAQLAPAPLPAQGNPVFLRSGQPLAPLGVIPDAGVPVAVAQAPALGGDGSDADPKLKAIVDRLVTQHLKAEADKKKQADDAKKATEELKKAEEKEQGVVVGSNLGANVSWRNGFWLETANKDFTFHLMGAVQYDLGLYSPQDNLVDGKSIHNIGPVEDGANVRRGRLRAEGSMWEIIDYRFELEFFNGVTPAGAAIATVATGASRLVQQQTFMTPGPTDAWFTIKNLPIVGNFRIGNQKEPIGLDHLEGFRWLPFTERSPLFDFFTPTAFNNGFNPGVMLFDSAFDQRMTWAIGGFKNDYDVYGFGLGGGRYAATGRLTWLPYYADEGKYLFHVGLAGSHRDPLDDQDRFRVRPSIRSAPAPSTALVPFLIDTGFFKMSSQDIVGLEAFANFGPLTFQAEYMGSFNQNSINNKAVDVGTTYFQGYYVQALYWLTGEYTRWDKRGAAPDRYIVNNPFFLIPGQDGWLRGTGAWQIGMRYSYIDANSHGINGGLLDDLTVGLNWILNNNTKFQWNYEFARRYGFDSNSNGNFNAFGMRMQFDF